MRNISVNCEFVSKQHDEITIKLKKKHVATPLYNM